MHGKLKGLAREKARRRSRVPGDMLVELAGWGNPLGEPNLHGMHGRQRGRYVRKPRKDYEHQQRNDSHGRSKNVSRKRGPRQMWVANGDPDRQYANDAFIRDTRQKTSSVFDRIAEINDGSADPGTQGHRDQ